MRSIERVPVLQIIPFKRKIIWQNKVLKIRVVFIGNKVFKDKINVDKKQK